MTLTEYAETLALAQARPCPLCRAAPQQGLPLALYTEPRTLYAHLRLTHPGVDASEEAP